MNKLAQLQLAKELLAQEYLQKQAVLNALLYKVAAGPTGETGLPQENPMDKLLRARQAATVQNPADVQTRVNAVRHAALNDLLIDQFLKSARGAEVLAKVTKMRGNLKPKAKPVAAKPAAPKPAEKPQLSGYDRDVNLLQNEGRGMVNDSMLQRLAYGKTGGEARRTARNMQTVATNPEFNRQGYGEADQMIQNMYNQTANKELAGRLALLGAGGTAAGAAYGLS